MSIQDDIFDVEAALEGKPEAAAFDRLYTYIGELETEVDELRPRIRTIIEFNKLMKELG